MGQGGNPMICFEHFMSLLAATSPSAFRHAVCIEANQSELGSHYLLLRVAEWISGTALRVYAFYLLLVTSSVGVGRRAGGHCPGHACNGSPCMRITLHGRLLLDAVYLWI